MPAPTYTENIGNPGYCLFGPEATIGTAVTPVDSAQMTDETMQTAYNFENQTPIAGNYVDTYQVLPGLRTHMGDITIVAEPNTATYLVDSLLSRGSVLTMYTFTVTSANATIGATYTNNGQTFTVAATIAASTTLICYGTGAPLASGTLTKATGTGDATITFSAMAAGTNYTWPFILANPSKSYTIDVSIGGSLAVGNGLVKRFYGCMVESLTPSFTNNQMFLKASISALGSYEGRLITTVTGAGPYTVNLDTQYTATPTAGLVVGDLIAFYNSANAITTATIASIPNSTSITTSTNVTTFTANSSIMYLRSQSPTFNILNPFLWSNTQFCFGSTASVALGAAQTRLEQGSAWNINWPFENKGGSPRSGNADPASLVRLTATTGLDIKKFFGSPQDIVDFNQLTKNACVIRHFAGSSNQYELRVTLNHLVTDSPVPSIGAKKVNYANIKYHTQLDTTDSQMFDLKLINGLATIT